MVRSHYGLPMHWIHTYKCDPVALALVDGGAVGKAPHYSRQQPGTRQFTRPGNNIVLITGDGLAVWVSWRPAPGKATRKDRRNCWECTLFRRESGPLSSELITQASELTARIWGPVPIDGLITFIRPEMTTRQRSKRALPGACFRHAGWVEDRPSADGKLCLRAPSTGPYAGEYCIVVGNNLCVVPGL